MQKRYNKRVQKALKKSKDWIDTQCIEVDACLNKTNSKKAYQLGSNFIEAGYIHNYPGQVWQMS